MVYVCIVVAKPGKNCIYVHYNMRFLQHSQTKHPLIPFHHRIFMVFSPPFSQRKVLHIYAPAQHSQRVYFML